MRHETEARLYLREWRVARGMTQQQLARRSGVRQAKISELETGAAKHWAPGILTALARALKCRPSELLEKPD
jgi:transcriptional regulator with XRE-family HTH domain